MKIPEKDRVSSGKSQYGNLRKAGRELDKTKRERCSRKSLTVNDFASIIPPGLPIPDPPEPKILALVLTVLGATILVLLIVFIAVESVLDMTGTPLHRQETLPPSEEIVVEPSRVGEQAARGALDAASEFTLLSPLPQSCIRSSRISVLCTWNPDGGDSTFHRRSEEPPFPLTLWVNDFYVPWDVQFGQNTWLANLKLPPGIHRLRTLAFEIDFYVDDSTDSAQLVDCRRRGILKSHENVDNHGLCSQCHSRIERPDDMIRRGKEATIGPWLGASSCLNCHSVKNLEQQHAHPLGPLEDCRRCHAVHGTIEPHAGLLKAPPEQLCLQCHQHDPPLP